jgi:4-amino-4-deoxy-L-arabinose transferase-like glycosyltransferase
LKNNKLLLQKIIRGNKLLILILIIGILVRIYSFGTIPPGLNQDEASIGYEAFSILNYGIDRNGFHNPVHLISWGSGQNALYAYLSMPFIYLFGLNVFSIRLLNLIFGLMSLFIFYFLIKKISNEKAALISTFLLSICPWHIIASRWGLESNIFPFIFLSGVFFLILSLEKNFYLPISFFFSALSLYAYGTSYFIVPLFLLISSVYLIFHKKIKPKMLIISFVIFLIIALPIFLFLIINHYELDSIETNILSIPRLPDIPRHTAESIFGNKLVNRLSSNLGKFWNLLKTQNDGLIWNNLPPYGFLYLSSLPLTFLGILLVFLKNLKVKKEFHKSFFVLIWFFLSIVLAILMEVNINRINIIFFPIIFFTALGLLYIKNNFNKIIFIILIVLYSLSFTFFLYSYFVQYPEKIGPEFFESFGDAINYASDTNKSICITEQANMLYIFILFYKKIDPNIFINTVKYENGIFGAINSFDRYYFGLKNDNCEAYVFHRLELKNMPKKYFFIKNFKYYSVAIRRDQIAK